MDFPVVGIGASAGGIPTLKAFLQSLPAHPNLALVIVQHTLPDRRSCLHSLFGKWSLLPVHEAVTGMAIERDCVYVAPPGQSMVVQNGVMVTPAVGDLRLHGGIDTIDTLFESLARDFGPRAVAVVLSGTGADGAAGVIRVRQAGGVVFVQDPATAVHDGMPKAAIATGAADRVVPVGALAAELLACGSACYVRGGAAVSWANEVGVAIDGMIELIRSRGGLDLTGYKMMPLLWPIQRRMQARNVALFRDYEALLHDDPVELEVLIRGIPIHVTKFFRDAEAWDTLRDIAIRPRFAQTDGAPIRAWTPACATGEEAYSVAMLMAEHASTTSSPRTFQVFATDASAEVVARASRGIFGPRAVAVLSAERREKFFYEADNAFRVQRSLRDRMVFVSQNLLVDPPFTGLDIVTCRNLLIYLEPDAARRVLHLLHSSLAMGGHLLLGRSETPPARVEGFEVASSRANLYRKVGRASEMSIDFPRRPAGLRGGQSSLGTVEAHAHRAILERSELPSVLVDEHFNLLRIYGDTGPYLRFKAGQPSLSLLDLAPAPLVPRIQAAAEIALVTQRSATISDRTDPVTGESSLRVRLTPLQSQDGGGTQLLISFIRGPSAGIDTHDRSGDPSEALVGDGGAQSLDRSDALRLFREELEASREELQALNQELKASNDEINSANEGLALANTQLQEKIMALEMQSRVLSSGAVMTLFLDEELRIRWFTPAIRELFPLVPADAGRGITDIAQRFDDSDFVGEVRAVMQTNAPREAEVRNLEGKWFLRRIGPYLARTDETLGVAVTFTDITARRRAEEDLRSRNEELERFNRVVVDRELRMIELKKEVNELRTQRGESPSYRLEFEEGDHDAGAG